MDAVDRLGSLPPCRDCPRGKMREKGLCGHRRTCVRDRNSPHIEGFVVASPRKAPSYLSPLYFELHACTASSASVFQLRALIDDDKSDVSQELAHRPSPNLAEKPISDPNRMASAVMARRAPPDILVRAMSVGVRKRAAAWSRARVRMNIAERLASTRLGPFVGHGDLNVRFLAAD